MPKGYWLPQIDVSDMDGYKAYMAATPPAHEKYKGVALARGGRSEVVEGRVRSRCVIREFPGLCRGARLLSLGRISAGAGSAPAAFAMRFCHCRGF